MNDPDSIVRGMKGCKYVFALAGYARNYSRNPEVFFKVNVDGLQNVLNAAKKLEVERIVATSTIVTFGPTPKGDLCDETHHGYILHRV